MRALLWVAIFSAGPAFAQRIAIAPFSGPNGSNVRNQLVAAVCDTADCVNTAKVTAGNKPDWKKAKKEAVQFFVTGVVAKKGKAQTLTLEVLSGPGKSKLKKAFPVGSDGLAAKTLQQAIDSLKGAFGGASPPAQPTEPEPVATTPAPTEVKPAEPTKTEPKKDAPPPPPKKDEPVEEPPPTKLKNRRIPFIAIEAGSNVLNRNFGYVQPVTNLRKYLLPVVGLATAKLEFYPLALGRQDILGGIGLEGSFSIAAWLKSRRENSTDDPYPTSTMRIDAGLAWRIMPVDSLSLAIIPLVGIRYHSFVVSPNAAGTRLDLLPNLTYLGVRAGLGFEVGVADDFIFIFGRFQAIPVLSSGEIISSAFFPKGSNFGLDGSIGVGIAFMKSLQLRLSGDFTRYGMTFTTDPTDAFVAQGAVDQYIGGTATLRFAY